MQIILERLRETRATPAARGSNRAALTQLLGEKFALQGRTVSPFPLQIAVQEISSYLLLLLLFSYKLQLSLRDFEDRRKDDDDDDDDDDAQVDDGGNGRRFGRRRNGCRSSNATSVVGRTMGKSTPIIPSMQLAQCPLRQTVESTEFAIPFTVKNKISAFRSNNVETNTLWRARLATIAS